MKKRKTLFQHTVDMWDIDVNPPCKEYTSMEPNSCVALYRQCSIAYSAIQAMMSRELYHEHLIDSITRQFEHELKQIVSKGAYGTRVMDYSLITMKIDRVYEEVCGRECSGTEIGDVMFKILFSIEGFMYVGDSPITNELLACRENWRRT